MRPLSRRDDLLIRQVDGEVIIYDQIRQKAHHLNESAAAVWRLADGSRTVSDLSASLHRDLGVPADESVVWLALRRLQATHLLAESCSLDEMPDDGFTRRQVVRRLGLGAAAAGALLPAISSLLAPTAAEAAGSCFEPGDPCTDGPQCCSGVCDTQAGICL